MLRHQKITQALKEEISSIIHDELNDPRLGFVTITRVELTPDIRYAKVFFSVLGQDQEYKKTKAALDSALGFIRRLIAQRIKLRLTPEIAFREDRSCEYSIRIQEILNEINPVRSKTPEAAAPPAAGTSNGVKEQDESKKHNRLHKKQ